jgi:Alpha-L-arabinofuranosidase B, catalytic
VDRDRWRLPIAEHALEPLTDFVREIGVCRPLLDMLVRNTASITRAAIAYVRGDETLKANVAIIGFAAVLAFAGGCAVGASGAADAGGGGKGGAAGGRDGSAGAAGARDASVGGAGGAAGADGGAGTNGVGGNGVADGGPPVDGRADGDGSGNPDDGVGPTSGPCDIYAAAGTPCVAAHSTTRALLAAYDGRLYQVQRASDETAADIGTLGPGGYADAAAQDTFCAGTSCLITTIYDQTIRGNHLTVSPAGGAGAADVGANAAALPATAGGHKVYGVLVTPGVGYRNLAAKGTARNGQPEGMYMVTSGKHVNDGCCFDYGNTEQPKANDTGNGHMDAVYFGLRCEHPPCTGAGPWIAADLENGLFQGNGSNTGDATATFDVVTAMLKNDGQSMFSLKTANAQSGALTTQYGGTLPGGQYTGYTPMSQEGGIVLGVGGDNSNSSAGDFYEGVMTAGYPTDAAEDAVQANIVAVNYEVATYTAVVPTSEVTKQTWRYVTNAPDAAWNTSGFDDGAWMTGPGGFGSDGTPGAIVGTVWSTADIWLRRTFNPGPLTPAELGDLLVRLHHDEDAEVYVNGVLALSASGYTVGYGYASMSDAARAAIVSNGANTLAVHCHQTTGGQYIDAGLYVLVAP